MNRTDKSNTDLHWDDRPRSEKDASKVNIADTIQRQLETDFVLPRVASGSRVLEVGCGNGYLTSVLRQRAGHVDAFDFSQNMIEQARKVHGEKNNRFFHDNLLEARTVKPPYDAIVCVRVLINLRNLDEQKKAIRNMASWLPKGGLLMLVEGYQDGFDRLNELRACAGIPALAPAAINYYCRLEELQPTINEHFRTEQSFHTGMFDFLTRVVYPALVGAEKASGPGEFHERILPVSQSFNPPEFESLARLRGFVLRRA